MPRKTRKEKMLSDKRKAQPRPVFTKPSDTSLPQNDYPTNSNTFQFKYTKTAHIQAKRPVTSIADYPSIKKDLLQTILLSAVALSAELVISRYLK